MNKHEKQVRNDLAKRLFVAMATSKGHRLLNYDSAEKWREASQLMATECFLLSDIWIEKLWDQSEMDNSTALPVSDEEAEL